ncbi:hypothetical protein BJ322DRAFT_1016710 [Thelephora terrestris]|uniref:Uncharacterized protein n=1 Tax=Thelephora terrestris TaxID=56493 RepID=A0A9P6HX09_9AGAM|nr:hypothetical protein BJ322DRAFT_1016710 [Thelephora terrestris]
MNLHPGDQFRGYPFDSSGFDHQAPNLLCQLPANTQHDSSIIPLHMPAANWNRDRMLTTFYLALSHRRASHMGHQRSDTRRNVAIHSFTKNPCSGISNGMAVENRKILGGWRVRGWRGVADILGSEGDAIFQLCSGFPSAHRDYLEGSTVRQDNTNGCFFVNLPKRTHVVKTEPFKDQFGPRVQRVNGSVSGWTSEHSKRAWPRVRPALLVSASSKSVTLPNAKSPQAIAPAVKQTHADSLNQSTRKVTCQRVCGEPYKDIDSSGVISMPEIQ